jgi:hypothetical protein
MNYTEIVAAAKAYSDRLDAEVSVSMPIFITMAEARINRVLKVGDQTYRIYTKSIEGKEYYTLPPEYNGMRILQFNSGEVDSSESATFNLDYVTPEQIVDFQQYNLGLGHYYTIVNNSIQVYPPLSGDGTLEIVFYRKVPPLTSSNKDNWMSIDHPDIYLSGICAEIELFVKNFEAAALWNDRMSGAIKELQSNDVDKRWTGSTLVMRVSE